MIENSESPAAFQQFKSAQREAWAGFAVNEGFTTPPAAELVKFAGVGPNDRVLDVGCGTGVVAITAARKGAKTAGLDLTSALLERARQNAAIAGVEVEFEEGDVENLPYDDGSFDVVLSQFGHMFAPRPAVATAQMLRVLKLGGRIAFSTWPPEHNMGRLFSLLARHMPQPLPGRRSRRLRLNGAIRTSFVNDSATPCPISDSGVPLSSIRLSARDTR
ncbi:MAG TPA: class I SAM-dependent methyltransferase [Tepidisphaeraceae bacterium]|nr:class I SAM-dependent methyltransferase [Tepidisphaeraceae bacterium]